MSDVADTAAAAPSAGRLLREARERQGVHIAVLAASIKVTQKKLEALEADRFDALPDATFTRALAQTVCRALKIDPTAVLMLLPPPAGHRLEQVGEGLNAPFRERPGMQVQRDSALPTLGPVFWVTALILAASLALYFLPPGWLTLAAWRDHGLLPARTTSPAASAALVPSPTPQVVAKPIADAPAVAASGADGEATSSAAEPTPPGAEPIPPGAEPIPPGAERIPAAAEPVAPSAEARRRGGESGATAPSSN